MAPGSTLSARRPLSATLLVAAALALLPGAATAEVVPRTAALETGGFSEFSQTNVEKGSLELASDRAFDGTASAHASYGGGGENGYSRGIWNVEWADGEEVWFGAAYYLPAGFHAAVQGQVDLLRWDNWASHPSDTDWGGVSIYGSDRRARLLRFGAGRPNDTLVGPIDLPEDRWFTLEVHQRLSSGGGALSELYVDGELVGSSTAPNTYGRQIERVRFGIVAIASGAQQRPLGLWFDRAATGPSPAGEIVASASSTSPAAAPRAARPCTTRRRTKRRPAWTRRTATVCRFAQRSCTTVRTRTRGGGGSSLRRWRACTTARRICLTRNRVVRRHGKAPRRIRRHGCRVRT